MGVALTAGLDIKVLQTCPKNKCVCKCKIPIAQNIEI